MLIIYFFFGYQKWFDYEAQGLIPFFTHGPLIFWMYSVFGIKGSSYFLGVSEWLFGGLILAGFWNKKLGALGALGSVLTFITTITIIPFMPDGWALSAGGFPAMGGERRLPDEGCGSPCGIVLSAEAGCCERCLLRLLEPVVGHARDGAARDLLRRWASGTAVAAGFGKIATMH
jgi:hypothetical protein